MLHNQMQTHTYTHSHLTAFFPGLPGKDNQMLKAVIKGTAVWQYIPIAKWQVKHYKNSLGQFN